MAALPTTSPLAFTVNWSGFDPEAGVQSYSVYVQDNGGAFAPWLQGSTLTEAVFTGQNGHSYGFYTLAIDNVGNVEAAKTAADASTLVAIAALTMAASPADAGTTKPSGTLSVTKNVAIDIAATPDTAHTFSGWTAAPSGAAVIADPAAAATAVTLSADATVTARFAIKTFTLTYTAGSNGKLEGAATQTVDYGASGTAVAAVANAHYHFVAWSDGVKANPRTPSWPCA